MAIGVYFITCEPTGRYYIGSSTDMDARLVRHFRSLRQGTHHNVFLQRVFNKYGEEAFSYKVLKEKTLEDARFLEQAFLTHHVDRALCMNIGRSASGGDNLTNNPNRAKIIKRMTSAVNSWMSSLSSKERKEKFGRPGELNGMYGKTHSKAARKKISEASKGNCNALGSVRDEAYRAALSERAKLRTGEKNPFYGKTHSKEAKLAMSLANIGVVPANARTVRIGKKKFASLAEASRVLNIPTPTIHYRINSPKYTEYSYI